MLDLYESQLVEIHPSWNICLKVNVSVPCLCHTSEDRPPKQSCCSPEACRAFHSAVGLIHSVDMCENQSKDSYKSEMLHYVKSVTSWTLNYK